VGTARSQAVREARPEQADRSDYRRRKRKQDCSPRNARGLFRCQAREPLAVLQNIRRTIGEYNFAGQYQQSPAPLGGGLVKAEWFKHYRENEPPERFDRIVQSWDTSPGRGGGRGRCFFIPGSGRGGLLSPRRLSGVELPVALFDATSTLLPGNGGADVVRARPLARCSDFLLRLARRQNKDPIIEGRRPMCESFFATLECELLDRCRFKTQTEARSAVFAFIEGFYNPRRRHSSIGYLSPVEYEHRHHAATVDRDAHQPAAVLAAVKDKPFGRPQDAAVLDRHRARQPRQCAGRDGRMAPPGAEPKNARNRRIT
jgi:hypothetical protein